MLSFVDVGTQPPTVQRHEGFTERLIIHADDCTPEDPPFNGRRLCPLSEAQAKQIARFVHANAKHIDTLVIHCHAGLSRSPGAGLAIAEALAIAEVEMVNGESVIPNKHVRELVKSAFQPGNEPA